jgi:hypothetical protein
VAEVLPKTHLWAVIPDRERQGIKIREVIDARVLADRIHILDKEVEVIVQISTTTSHFSVLSQVYLIRL